MKVTAGGGLGARLRREVLVPVPSYRRASSLIGLSVILVLMASAIDAVVWTYQTQRRLWREEVGEAMRPSFHRRHAQPVKSEKPVVKADENAPEPQSGCRYSRVHY